MHSQLLIPRANRGLINVNGCYDGFNPQSDTEFVNPIAILYSITCFISHKTQPKVQGETGAFNRRLAIDDAENPESAPGSASVDRQEVVIHRLARLIVWNLEGHSGLHLSGRASIRVQSFRSTTERPHRC
jgi:hypothetical protein